jgi:hypothetical protein
MAMQQITGESPGSAGGPGNHHAGFNQAMDVALAKMSRQLTGGGYDVDVSFAMHVKVTNPGTVAFYSVTFAATPSP